MNSSELLWSVPLGSGLDAKQISMTRQSAYRNLRRLHDSGVVGKRKLGHCLCGSLIQVLLLTPASARMTQTVIYPHPRSRTDAVTTNEYRQSRRSISFGPLRFPIINERYAYSRNRAPQGILSKHHPALREAAVGAHYMID